MESFMKEFEHLKISLEEIKKVTNNFNNKPIGSGGFGEVYEGELSHSKGRSLVAIKRLDRKFGQGDSEFWKEIVMLTRYSHENLISLLGFCDEAGEKIIVYELASNGSLDQHLSSPDLTWEQRIKICLGAAKGLRFLHDDKGIHQRVIHRDVKSSNILLNDEWKAKVSDMGLSKLGPANQEHTALFTNVVGTLGYLDPVYLHQGVLTKESDVYSFGVVLFEVLCGRLCFSNRNLVPTWKQSYKNKKIHTIMFQDLTPPMEMTSLETFSDIAFQCVQGSREKRPTMSHVVEKLEMALEFQQCLDLKLPKEYVNILKVVTTPLRHNSLEELRLLFPNGVFLDAGKTWFSINDKGEHSVLISIDECLIREAGKDYTYSRDYISRFPVGIYSAYECKFKAHVRTQFLSPNTTYSVKLVYKHTVRRFTRASKRIIELQYKLEGETKTWTSYLADEREDGWYAVELCQFISDGTPVNLDIIFEESAKHLALEGIEFQSTINVEERHVSDDEKQVDMQPPLSYSDDNAYWEQKLPDDYHEIMKQSKDKVEWKTKKELYSVFRQGFLINYGSFLERLFNDGQWFSLDKNGKKCLMLPARAAFKVNKTMKTRWIQSDDSRFGEMLTIKETVEPVYLNSFKYHALSLSTKYACYLVYKLQDQSDFELPLTVRETYGDQSKSEFSHVYLVSPQTPVIRQKVDEIPHKPLSRPKLKGLPQQRNDLWMEVQVHEFQTTDTSEGFIWDLEVTHCENRILHGLILQGVEYRPI
uniref:uncharacterized protein LOC122600874 n=1 Tax=Erigeron canadensis TaxID=72917 RepID=UPI001CB9AA44|nr:uncharacterized protein LOC122600874 [Erigeron canadensis]